MDLYPAQFYLKENYIDTVTLSASSNFYQIRCITDPNWKWQYSPFAILNIRRKLLVILSNSRLKGLCHYIAEGSYKSVLGDQGGGRPPGVGPIFSSESLHQEVTFRLKYCVLPTNCPWVSENAERLA